MTVSPGPTDVFNGYPVDAGGGASIARASYGVRDSVGFLGVGAAIPGLKDVGGGGKIYGVIDAGRYFDLPVNQRLLLSVFFDYHRDNISYGSTAGLAAAGISGGSLQLDTYKFGGTFNYNINTMYINGAAAIAFGRGGETQSIDGSNGSFSTIGYSTDLRVGKVFVVLNRLGSAPSGASAAGRLLDGGYILGLDLGGRLGYGNQILNGFTDSTDYSFGASLTQYGIIGGRAKFFLGMPNNGVIWEPYVAAAIDQQFGFSSKVTIPSQATLPSGDVLNLQQAQTFYSGQLGFDVRGAGGTTIGVNGFYSASTDANRVGGRAYLKIPLGGSAAPAVFAARY
jgi:hypothetical protein